MGAAPGCTTLTQDQDLVVGRPEAIYFYSPDGRGPCFVLEGMPSGFDSFKNHFGQVLS